MFCEMAGVVGVDTVVECRVLLDASASAPPKRTQRTAEILVGS